MSDKRFRVAFSFAGEKRDFVAKIAEILAKHFGREAILYDKFHEAELARPNLGIFLPDLYHKQSDLIVVVVCLDYDKKEWPGLEWMAIHDLIKKRKDDDVMLCRFNLADVKGLYSSAGWVELDQKSPEETANLILERLAINEGKAKDFYNLYVSAPAVKYAGASTGKTQAFINDGEQFEEPTIVWRLPRGFIILTDIVKQKRDSWATIADYCDYDGTWRHGTHFHESYSWERDRLGIEGQCSKLGIPKGDWYLARSPIYLMMEIRKGELLVNENGELEGRRNLDPRIATVHLPGAVPLPTVPSIYLGLFASGKLRDLAIEAESLSERDEVHLTDNKEWNRFEELAKGLRREARTTVYEMLSPDHPASKNLEEIVGKFTGERDGMKKWLREFSCALREAATIVQKLREAGN